MQHDWSPLATLFCKFSEFSKNLSELGPSIPSRNIHLNYRSVCRCTILRNLAALSRLRNYLFYFYVDLLRFGILLFSFKKMQRMIRISKNYVGHDVSLAVKAPHVFLPNPTIMLEIKKKLALLRLKVFSDALGYNAVISHIGKRIRNFKAKTFTEICYLHY